MPFELVRDSKIHPNAIIIERFLGDSHFGNVLWTVTGVEMKYRKIVINQD